MKSIGVAQRFASSVWRIALVLSAVITLAACGKDNRVKSAEARPRLHACEYGMTIFFGQGGDSQRVRLTGWSHTEPLFTWTDGDNATLGVRLPPSKHAVRLDFKLAGFTAPPQLPYQPVDVFVNGEKLASWEVAEMAIHSVVVPPKMVAAPKRLPDGRRPFVLEPGTRLLVEFRIPKATSPLQVGESGDPRRLGLCVSELVISNPPSRTSEPAADGTGG